MQINNIDTVFIVASWTDFYPLHTEAKTHTIYEALSESLDLIPDKVTVVLMHRVPGQPYFHIRTLFYQAIANGVLTDVETSRTSYLTTNAASRQAIEQIANERANVFVLDPIDIFCTDTECSYAQEGEIIYTDSNHINATGALLLAPLVSPYLLY